MKFHILTLFPEMVMSGLNTSIIGRAVSQGLIHINAVNIRDYTKDKHGKVDDYPYGGGAGMLMQAQPVYDAYQAVTGLRPVRTVYVTPQGRPFTQQMAEDLAGEEELVFLCGHYEGIDERVLEEIVTDYVSIGDYVLTGGELPAMVMIDAVSRLVPGVLNNEVSAETESFHNDLLEYPQYSRPEVWHGKAVPKVLLSGNHKNIIKWRLEQSQLRTLKRRPDLYEKYQEKLCTIKDLSKKKREHIHMMEMLSRGNGEVLYHVGETVLLYQRKNQAYVLSANDLQSGEMLGEIILQDAQARGIKPSLFVVSRDFLKDMVERKFDVQAGAACLQACYTRKESLPVRHKDIRKLDKVSLDDISDHYHNGSARTYLCHLLENDMVYGAFVEEQLVGFIGMHTDGSMGLLYVQEEFRRQGIAASLEGYLINRILELGWTPYAQIYADNEASLKLQEKLGLYLSKGTLWWLGKM